MKPPVKFQVVTSSAYRSDIAVWWKRIDYVFRFLGWSIMTGVVKNAAAKSDDFGLSLIAGLMGGMLIFMVIRISRFQIVLIPILPKLSERTLLIIARMLSYTVTLIVGLAGGYLYNRSASSLTILQTVK
jgi:uncharacterized protein YneF (UPF0154 family)